MRFASLLILAALLKTQVAATNIASSGKRYPGLQSQRTLSTMRLPQNGEICESNGSAVLRSDKHYQPGAIDVLHQGNDHIIFTAAQIFDQDVAWMSVVYKGESGATVCNQSKSSPAGYKRSFKAQCQDDGFATVKLYVHNSAWDGVTTTEVPKQCSFWPADEGDVVEVYSYRLACGICEGCTVEVREAPIDHVDAICEGNGVNVLYHDGEAYKPGAIDILQQATTEVIFTLTQIYSQDDEGSMVNVVYPSSDVDWTCASTGYPLAFEGKRSYKAVCDTNGVAVVDVYVQNTAWKVNQVNPRFSDRPGDCSTWMASSGVALISYELSCGECADCTAPHATLEIKKYAGEVGECGVNMENVADDSYTLPSVSSQWAYCYVITNPSTSEECLVDMSLTDEAGGGVGVDVPVDVAELCPGETIYVPGPTNPGTSAPEGPVDAVVIGTGQQSGSSVTDRDDASVQVPETAPVPAVNIIKYAGPAEECGADMTDQVKDDLYFLPTPDSEWSYCYAITVPLTSEECLVDMSLTDEANGGVGVDVAIDVSELCPGETIYVPGPTNPGSSAPENPVDAIITGMGKDSGNVATDRDDASVVPPVGGGPDPREEPTTPFSCPEVELYAANNIKLKHGSAGNFGSAANFPIRVLSQDVDTVEFEICSGDSDVYAGFVENLDYKCYGVEGSASECQTFVADCTTTGDFAVVDLHVVSPFTGDDAAFKVPECCIPEQPDSAVYVFVLRCSPCV